MSCSGSVAVVVSRDVDSVGVGWLAGAQGLPHEEADPGPALLICWSECRERRLLLGLSLGVGLGGRGLLDLGGGREGREEFFHFVTAEVGLL